MKRLGKWAVNLGIVALIALGLVGWGFLPWWGVLAVAVLVALWLLLTRRGRQALAVASVGVSTLPSAGARRA